MPAGPEVSHKQARCVLCVVVMFMYVHVWEREIAFPRPGRKVES